MANAVLSMAARRVLQAALKIRKEQAGELIKSARSIDVLQIPDKSDWERCHTATSEPYFYDQSYTQVKRDGPICIDGKGICYIAKVVGERKNDVGRPKKWNCTPECKVLTVEECKSIVNLKAIFQECMPSLRQALEDIDSGCNYGHYSIPWEIIAAKHDKLEVASDDSKQPEDSKPVSNGTLSEDSKPADVPTNDSKLLEEAKPVDAPTADSILPIHKEDEKRVDDPLPVAEDSKTDHSTQPSCQEDGKPGDVPIDDNDEEKEEDSIPLFRELLGHPLACYQVDSGCKSKLRVLRSAAPHYPLMRKLLRLVYEAMRCNRIIKTIDSTLRMGDFETLCKLCGFKPLVSVRRSGVTADMLQEPKLLNLESQLRVDYARMIADLEKKLADDPEFPCCSCEWLHQRKQVMAFKFHEAKFSSNM